MVRINHRYGSRTERLGLWLLPFSVCADLILGWCFRLIISMMRRILVTSLVVGGSLLSGLASAQGTKLWTVGRYDEMEKGTAEGVAIRSDGRLEAGPATSLLYAT